MALSPSKEQFVELKQKNGSTSEVEPCQMGPKYLLPPSQIIRHSKNLGESKDLKFDQIYMIR
jgi:hypothetical protein